VRKLVISVLLVAVAVFGWQHSRAPRWDAPAYGAEPQTVRGAAVVVDGDSLEIGGARIRLHAVDAFESRQQCTRDSAAWACGAAAARKLRELVGTNEIACTRTDTDSYGRMVAICKSGSVDLGAEIVSAGLALAYRQYGADYVPQENAARAAKRGAWAGEFKAPWDYRHGSESQSGRERGSGSNEPPAPALPGPQSSPRSPQPGGQVTPQRCSIKGNISRSGERIYHLPGTRDYDATIIDPGKGERWFCTEDEARAEGWRAPRG
jgi:endonuclease YncB( thermonuclease family)